MLSRLFFGILLLAFIFVPAERLFPIRRQRVFRPGWRTDLEHFFISSVLVQVGVGVAAVLVVVFTRVAVPQSLRDAVAGQTAWAQFVEAVVIAELATYTGHRLAHTVPAWWRLHRVHHSSERLDWLASARVHPLDQVLMRSCAILPLATLGFSAATFGAYLAITQLEAIFVHANVRFRFGPLKWLVMTPEFHHWHHALEPQDKNFGGQLPLWDIVFGTVHMPKRRWPSAYGIPEPMPHGYFAQLESPFRPAPAPVPLPYAGMQVPPSTQRT